MMALLAEFVATIILLVSKPFSLIQLACIFGLRTISIIISTWGELLRAAISLHVNIFGRLCFWTLTLLSLPVRVLTAFQRERLLEMQNHELQNELETFSWNRKELEDRLQLAIKERKMMEIMLADLEEEHDQALIKMEILEAELQDVKSEYFRVKEVQGKDRWSFKSEDPLDTGLKSEDKKDTAYGLSPRKPVKDGSGVILQDLLREKDGWEEEDDGKYKTEFPDFAREGLKPTSMAIDDPNNISRGLYVREILDQRRNAALLQSVFSAILSLLVGMIIWEAEDPCMPLVVALFSVVGMSLKTVVQFFSTIKNKPAADAVALLSLNWFILGTLTYPSLPRIARMLTPWALTFLDHVVKRFGFSLESY